MSFCVQPRAEPGHDVATMQSQLFGPATARRPANVFGDESDEEDVEAQIKRQADKKRAAAKVCIRLRV
jgi:hypothetical protein